MEVLAYIVVAVGGYLLGSIPTGYLVARAKGIDIRAVGSGNIGATNVLRILGKPAGIAVLLGDTLKGFAAVTLIVIFFPDLNSAFPDVFATGDIHAGESLREHLGIAAGIGAVLGHNYTCWLRFKGGKGIATSAGVYFALAPLAAGIALCAWIIFFAVTRYVSVASLASAVALPTAVWFTKDSVILGVVTTAVGLLAIVKHRENIKRLLGGTERRFGKKSNPPEDEK